MYLSPSDIPLIQENIRLHPGLDGTLYREGCMWCEVLRTEDCLVKAILGSCGVEDNCPATPWAEDFLTVGVPFEHPFYEDNSDDVDSDSEVLDVEPTDEE